MTINCSIRVWSKICHSTTKCENSIWISLCLRKQTITGRVACSVTIMTDLQKSRTASASWLMTWGTRLGILVLFIASCSWLDTIKVCSVVYLVWFIRCSMLLFQKGPMVCLRTEQYTPARTGCHRCVTQQHSWNDQPHCYESHTDVSISKNTT